jgi:NADPH:quinone reductase-like Zn-dependent oxidoreductase
MLGSGAWAERVAAPTHALAVLPDSVSDAQAATLPVAGLTALYALRKGGLLLEQPILITGATGGVGDFALQLARLSGARVVAQVRRPEQAPQVREAGADAVVVGDGLPDDQPFGPYHLVVESVGGKTLGAALNQLAEGGMVVSLGATSGAQVTFDASRFYPTGRASLYGFILFDELKIEPAGRGLEILARLVAERKLTTRISVESGWSEIAPVAQQLTDRAYPGKAVLHLR